MKFGKRVLVCVDLNEHTKESLELLRQLEFLKHSEVYFVHVFRTIVYNYGLTEYVLIYPVADDRKAMEQTVLSSLANFTKDVLPEESKDNVHLKCLFDESPKRRLCHYAEEIKADTIVVMAREKHGLFDSSVAQYLARHSNRHLVILKPSPMT